MAETKISELTELAAIESGDLLLVSEDAGGGNYVSKKYDAVSLVDAISKKHTQGTDTGTTSTTFQIDSGNSGPKLKQDSGAVHARNAADDADAPVKAASYKTGAFTLTVDETASVSDKADKDTDAVVDNLAVFDANGNPVDSGISKNLVYPDPAYTLDIQPTLNLDFAAQAYRSHVPGSGLISWPLVGGDSKITVTRATTATYFDPMGVLRTAAAGVPRIDHDPATGECLGLLVEEARTNLCLQSEDLSTTWANLNTTESVNAVVAPDGETTADKLVEDTATGEHLIRQDLTIVADTDYCFSLFAKASGRSDVKLRFVDSSGGIADGYIECPYDLAAGTAGTVTALNGGAVVGSGIDDIGNGWYRCWVAGKFNTTDTDGRLVITMSNGSGYSYTGDGSSGLYIWGAQLEAGAFPTSYIPTTTAAVTRNADVVTMTGVNFSDWYNQSEGAILVEAKLLGVSLAALAAYITEISDGTNYERMRVEVFEGNARFVVNYGGAIQVVLSSAVSVDTFYKLSSGYKADDFGVSLDGGAVSADTSGSIPVVDRLVIGSRATFTSDLLNGHIKQLQYYPRRLTNTQLQALSA